MLVIIAIAILGKLGGASLAARATGTRWKDSMALGVLMNTRGLVELVILNAGLELGILTPPLFTMMVIMALVTTFMAAPVLRAMKITAPKSASASVG
jgi:Kef-type K+ transport system membrane component KefB